MCIGRSRNSVVSIDRVGTVKSGLGWKEGLGVEGRECIMALDLTWHSTSTQSPRQALNTNRAVSQPANPVSQ